MKKGAVYPGSFDPITNAHVDIIQRGLKIFDKIIVAVLDNPKKRPLFSTRERVRMIRDVFPHRDDIEVKAFRGLLADFLRRHKIHTVIRGLRAVSDFEYELQMALMNRTLDPAIETLFMMPSLHYTFLSSSLVKEIVILGGSVQGFVPAVVERRLSDLTHKPKGLPHYV
jgi:pantetheine-phosphate adenylyltransferase